MAVGITDIDANLKPQLSIMIISESSIKWLPIRKVSDDVSFETSDAIAIEEPLEIRLEFGPTGDRKTRNISVTMRTPGDDKDLATGFLFTEGIINNNKDILNVDHVFFACAENKENVIQVALKEGVTPQLQSTERNFYTTSSCGVCGKGSINAIKTVSVFSNKNETQFAVSADLLHQLPGILLQHQAVFSNTGGLHASALFSKEGELLLVREDVGRHNALDKLIGSALNNNSLPLSENILLLSGRASFELVQKAAMAGINIIASVGAPSSLAVELAKEFNITLVGFLRNQRFNIYSAEQRILQSTDENSDQGQIFYPDLLAK
ncbi:formate dehydrogenase accessory sulfurtransferase FdhD [Chitinophagaceae bacterium 26-R-25]|nr:formate dehydrogenase accessory sulfurtransferase FdhD [Chitinophagaceae bacterium 26-R-25]